MNPIIVQAVILLLLILSFIHYLAINSDVITLNVGYSGRINRSLQAWKESIFYVLRSLSIKSEINILSILKVIGLGVLINFLAFDIIEESLSIRFQNFEIFILYAVFICISKLSKIENVDLYKISIEVISDVIFILLISAQYHLITSVAPGIVVNIIFALIFAFHFGFAYLLESCDKNKNIVTKLIDFQIKACWFLLMIAMFFNIQWATPALLGIELYIVFIIVIHLFSIIEKETNKLIFRQSLKIYRKYYLAAVMLTSLGSVLIAYFN